MGSSLVQTPVNKINSEFVDRATELITKITEQIDKCCPACKALLKSGLGNPTPNPADADINNPEVKSGVVYTGG